MFKIGVVCEGQTDFVAIKAFLEAEFFNSERKIELSIIQPAIDNSLPSGWSEVLYWLENNDLALRSSLYSKNGSLFETEDEDKKFDALLFHVDSDILGEPGFETFIKKRGITYKAPVNNVDRGNAIRSVILSVAGHASDAVALTQNEVATPMVESSEAWLIAAENVTPDAETLIGQPLINAFGDLVARALGEKPKGHYVKINKKVKTREKLCDAQLKACGPKGRAHHFDEVVQKIASL